MNFDKYVNSRFYQFFDFLFVFIFANILWLITTFLGLVVFSVMPASIALHSIIINRINGHEVSVFKEFFSVFKTHYKSSQKAGFLLAFFTVFVALNTSFYSRSLSENDLFSFTGLVLSMILLFGLFFTWVNLFNVYVFFPHIKGFKLIKYTLYLGLSKPVATLIASLGVAAILLLIFIMPTIFGFIGISLISLLLYYTIGIKYLNLADRNTALIKEKRGI